MCSVYDVNDIFNLYDVTAIYPTWYLRRRKPFWYFGQVEPTRVRFVHIRYIGTGIYGARTGFISMIHHFCHVLAWHRLIFLLSEDYNSHCSFNEFTATCQDLIQVIFNEALNVLYQFWKYLIAENHYKLFIDYGWTWPGMCGWQRRNEIY